jgi:hypothetical protein
MEPGRYLVRGLKVQGPEWVRAFSRWSICIEFATVHEPGGVSAFFNLGSDRLKQYIGRQSKYFQAWTLANGGLPRKGEQMSPEKRTEVECFRRAKRIAEARDVRRKRERSLCVLALSRFCLADERPPSVRNSAEKEDSTYRAALVFTENQKHPEVFSFDIRWPPGRHVTC